MYVSPVDRQGITIALTLISVEWDLGAESTPCPPLLLSSATTVRRNTLREMLCA